MMKLTTLGIILRDGKMLLGEKKKGEIGVGLLSGPGGKHQPGETLWECLIRETREELEIELDPKSLKLVAIIDAYVLKDLDFRIHVYKGEILSGDIHETAEMIPGWYPLDEETFRRTYESDRHWLPRAARGERFRAEVYYRSRARDFERIEFFELL
ncbi:MAG: NUDIX domain-containing protein [Patescibacteria group bacterium]|nr:NUDIX domain-containing protein [Patescibacteria group bacterium]